MLAFSRSKFPFRNIYCSFMFFNNNNTIFLYSNNKNNFGKIKYQKLYKQIKQNSKNIQEKVIRNANGLKNQKFQKFPLNKEKKQTNLSQKYNKVDKFNMEIDQFIKDYQKQNEQISQIPIDFKKNKSSWNFISNLYRFIVLKAQEFNINPITSITVQSNRKISSKVKQKQNNEIDFQNWTQTKHFQLCQSFYLSLILQHNKSLSNLQNIFLYYLRNLPSKITTNNTTISPRFIFVNTQSYVPSSPNSNTFDFVIQIDKIVYTNNFQNNLSFQIIKAFIESENRSKNQIFQSLKAFCTLLTQKQLRKLDTLIYQHLLTPKQLSLKINLSQNLIKQKRILTLAEVGKLTSILSQLNLKGNAIYACQSIFQIIISKEINTNKEIAKIISNFNVTDEDGECFESINQIQQQYKKQLDFETLLKHYIGIAELGGLSKDFQEKIEKNMILRMQLKKIINKKEKEVLKRRMNEIRQIKGGKGSQFQNLKLKQDTNNIAKQHQNTVQGQGIEKAIQKLGYQKVIQNFEKLKERYCLDNKNILVLINTFHKFKKGNLVFNFKSDQSQNQVKNVWLSLHQHITKSSTRTPPAQVVFPLLSGIYRNYNTFILSSLHFHPSSTHHIHALFSTLIIQLYSTDPSLSYLKDLSLQNIIQFIIVISSTLYISSFHYHFKFSQLNSRPNIQQNIKIMISFMSKIGKQMRIIEQKISQDKKLIFNSSKKNKQEKSKLYSILKSYILYTKINLCFLQKIYKDKTQQAQISERMMNQQLEKMVKQIKTQWKNAKITQQIMTLFNLMIDNSKNLLSFLDENQIIKNKKENTEIQQMINIYNDLLSYVGFSKQGLSRQYQQQLIEQLVQRSLINDSDESLIKSIKQSKNLNQQICFVKHILYNEEIIRISLIQNQESFKQYQSNNPQSFLVQ